MNQSPAPQMALVGGRPEVELSSNRTGLSLERTHMSADRTLMSTIRTSLSLIGFGFTIHSVFKEASALLPQADRTANLLGLALLALGVTMLAMGIAGHVRFDRELNRRRARLHDVALLRGAKRYRATPSLIVAVLLLITGLVTLASVVIRLT